MAQTKPKAGQFYGVSDNGADGQFLKTDGAGGMSWDSPITNPTITSIDYPGSQTATDPAGGESVIINGTLFASGITCTVGGTSAVTAFNSATQITITTPAKAAGQYAVAVTNSNGGTASQANFIQYSGVPVWSTASGSLGNVLEGASASFQVTATEGSDTIEYAVTTGTLPTGLSLNTNTGAITGTAPTVTADTTTTFSITATDDENQTSSERSFSITVQNDLATNHFEAVTYTGNGSTQSIAGLGFQPDMVWIKPRSYADNHNIFDSIRGVTKQIIPNGSSAESTQPNTLQSFNSNGFTTGSDNNTNLNNETYVAWCWKAGGTAVSNTDGTIDSQVSVNNTLGFSIVKYTAPSGSTAKFTAGHGLSSTPQLVITRRIGGGTQWYTYSETTGTERYLTLNSSNAQSSTVTDFWGTDGMSATAIGLTNNQACYPNEEHITYCFASKPGFSKVGTYTGSGVVGNTVMTVFEPAFIIIKRSSGTGEWYMFDNKRLTGSYSDQLAANSSAAEVTGTYVKFLANGFQLNTAASNLNENGSTFIYLAIAADGSTTTPSLANSFATEIYTGNASSRSITTGFKPDFVWLKSRSNSSWHVIHDSIRGAISRLFPNEANAASSVYDGFVDFEQNGFSLDGTGSGGDVNASGRTYVSWSWKAGGTPSINTDGSITSLVSVNQAAGFSIVNYKGNEQASQTVGHGLNGSPEIAFIKQLDGGRDWAVPLFTQTSGDYMYLNNSQAESTDTNLWSAVSSTTFTVGADPYTNGAGSPYIGYFFKSIAGYSKVGTYTGLGSGGPLTVNVGFAPTLGLIKRTDSTGGWRMFDTVRGTDKSLRANESLAEYDDTANYMDFTSTGFYFSNSQTNSDINAAGGTYIYLAIKEN
jgi:hypothetical protein